jgi:hypothetical protein
MNRLQENNEIQRLISYVKERANMHNSLFLEIQEEFLLAIQIDYEAKRLRDEEDLLIILEGLESKASIGKLIPRYLNTYPAICLLLDRVKTSASIISALRDAFLISFIQLKCMINELNTHIEIEGKANVPINQIRPH